MVVVQIRDNSATVHMHDDYCSHVNSPDVSSVLALISELISEAHLYSEPDGTAVDSQMQRY